MYLMLFEIAVFSLEDVAEGWWLILISMIAYSDKYW
jgi:hypothetical protein